MSEEIIFIGMILCLSSGVLYRYRLMQFSDFLKTHCPHIWESHITANGKASRLVRSNNLRSLALIYESDNRELNDRLKSLALLYKSLLIGLFVVFVGIIIDMVHTIGP